MFLRAARDFVRLFPNISGKTPLPPPHPRDKVPTMRDRLVEDESDGAPGRGSRTPTGFTLVELVVALAIIIVLMAILLPAVAAARSQAKTVECSSNVRQLCLAFTAYAAEAKGSFPPNVSTPAPGRFWYHAQVIAPYLNCTWSPSGEAEGRALTCPADDGARRSYAMNFWASSAVEPSARAAMPARGVLWKQSAPKGAHLILVAERWSSVGSQDTGWVSAATVGRFGDHPGRRFGVGGGLIPLLDAGRFGMVNCELTYDRHGRAGRPRATGRLHIGYADGHVALKSQAELGDLTTGMSTLDSWWTPIDTDLNR